MHACCRQSLLLLCCSLLHRDALLHGAVLLISILVLIMKTWWGFIAAPLELGAVPSRAEGGLAEAELELPLLGTSSLLLYALLHPRWILQRKLPSVLRKVLCAPLCRAGSATPDIPGICLLSWNILPFKYFTWLLMLSSWGKQPPFKQAPPFMCRAG